MNFNRPDTKNSTAVIRAVCAIVFGLFTFVYLYFYQADVLAVAQHVLSGGATHYDRLIGCVVIMLCLWLLQIGVYIFFRLERKFHALTYFPSLLVLTFITDVSPHIDRGFSFGAWLWAFPLLLILWGGIAFALRDYQRYDKIVPCGLFSRAMWINMLTMTVMLLFVGLKGTGNAVFHYRMYAEGCLIKNDYAGAAAVGKRSLETDAGLTMIRMYALAHEGRLADELFTYRIAGTSDDIIPTERGAHCMIYPNDSIYRYLGAKPAGAVRALPFLKTLIKKNLASDAVKDYILCGYLIDRNLDEFVRLLPVFYEVDDKLPRHYREALTLYTRLRSNPYIVYHDNVMDTDLKDLQTLERQYDKASAREVAVTEQYSGTYWWYYEYGRK